MAEECQVREEKGCIDAVVDVNSILGSWSTDSHFPVGGDESSADDRNEPPGRVRSRVV
jgi:hypothetical protein